MTEPYEQIIEVNGRVYRYDPEWDLYYRCDPQPEETLKEKTIKIICAVAVLALIVGLSPLWTQ